MATIYGNRYCSGCKRTTKMRRQVGYDTWKCDCGMVYQHEWKREGGYLQADKLHDHIVRKAED